MMLPTCSAARSNQPATCSASSRAPGSWRHGCRVEDRIADDQRPHAPLPATRHAAGESGFHEHLPAHRVPLAEPVAVVMQQLPRISHQLARDLQLEVRRHVGRLVAHALALVFEDAAERLEDVLAEQAADRSQVGKRLRVS